MKKLLAISVLFLLVLSLGIVLAENNFTNGTTQTNQTNQINGTTQTNETECEKKGLSCCIGDLCNDIMLNCAEGHYAKVTGCDDDCMATGECVKNEDDDDCDQFCQERKRERKETREQTKEAIKDRNRLRLNNSECPDKCECSGSTTKCQLGEGGREMTIRAGNSGNIIVQVKGVNATTQVTLYHHNGKLYGNFSGNETEIIDPEQAQERIKNKIHAKLNLEDLELTEEGYYKIQIKKRARLFAIFPVNEKVEAKIMAENGEIVRVRNPWWGWLAKDTPEDETNDGEDSTTGSSE